MSYNGFEIFFQNLGNADSIFVRYWANGVPTNILIDGGWRSSVDQVEGFLADRARESGIATIHHMVCSHCDDDHAGGLVPLVERGKFPIVQAWVHDARDLAHPLDLTRRILLNMRGAKMLLERVEKAEATRQALLGALATRRINVQEPYAGNWIGPMVVLGPTADFFGQQYAKLDEELFVEELERRLEERARREALEASVGSLMFEAMMAAEEQTKELGGAPTTPVNEVSTVLALPWESGSGRNIYLFTGDVGREGLAEVIGREGQHLHALRWMQAPHHGSRRSMTREMIDHFAPAMSFISCEGTRKHPSQKLVNALKLHGRVYSTHYSVNASGWLRLPVGTVPSIPTSPAFPLYEKPSKQTA